MQFQTALRKSSLEGFSNNLRLVLAPTMHQPIICIPTPGQVGKRPRHPDIERIMHKEIGQDRANYALNAKDNFRFERTIVEWRSGNVLDLRRKR